MERLDRGQDMGTARPTPTRGGRTWDSDPVAFIHHVLARRAVFPLFQPIVDLATRTLVGVEALARGPAGTPVEFPDALFAAANRAGLLPQIDQLCATRAHEVAQQAGALVPPLVFINAEPAAIDQPYTPELLAAIGSARHYRRVLEFTERALADHPAALLTIADTVHRSNGALALDDVGADPLSLALLPLIEPEVVKLDMHLVRNPHTPQTITTAEVASGYAERCGTVVLAEGVETEQDLATAHALGARWGQGWLFARPGPLAALTDWPRHPDVRLRPPQPELHLPSGTPFANATARHPSRIGDQQMLNALATHLLSLAATAGGHTVVLGAYPRPSIAQAWLPHLLPLTRTAALVALVGPALPAGTPPQLRLTTPPNGGLQTRETVLAVVSPYTTIALCARPHPDSDATGEVEFVLTHDRGTVHTIARALLLRLDTGAARPAIPATIAA